ncbi:MAG TPA: IPT/TIG domain-containing protein [Opitutaceae bacterium]|nr:IPT/TIG domain-containing protein [Opitutaceae bacterium]
MHTNRISPARKILLWLTAIAGLALLAGCDIVTLTDLTPASMPENPSQIYTFSLRVAPRSNTVPAASISPHIVVDGQNYEMKKSPLGEGIYDFEYQLPAGREEVAYYFLVTYNIEGNGTETPHESYTEVAHVKIVHRYVLSLEVNRGPVGARISVLGRGFTPQDQINFNGSPARTVFESPNALSFFVPPLDANHNYRVTLNSASGNSPVGTFRIDPSNVTVFPTSLTLRAGAQQVLTFTIPNAAPPGGTLLDVTTDVPECVIMPEVIVPQGQTSVSVNVEGGKPGSCTLFLKGYGAGEVTIPVTVTAK